MSDYSATTNAYMNLASQKADLAYKNQYMQMGGAYNPTTNSVFTNTGTNAVYANNNVAFTGDNSAVAQVSADGSCTDGADDGKLSFGETVGNFFKGLVSPVTSLFESPGNFIKGVAIMAGCAALTVATGGAAAPLLVAGGCALGGFQAVKGVVGAANAKTDAEAKAAWQSIGAGTGAIALSVAGAKSAAKAGGFYEEGMSSLQATKACFTNVGKSASASLEAFTSGEAMSNLKAAFGKGKAAPSENKAPAEKTSTELYEEGAPEGEVIQKAKAERLSHQNDKALTTENANSPQAESYKLADETPANDPKYLEHKAQRNARVSERMELDAEQLGKSIEAQKAKLAEAREGGYKGAQRVAKENIKMYEGEYERLTGHKYESSVTSEQPTASSTSQTARASQSDTLHSFDELKSYLDEGAFEPAPETPVRYEIKMEKVPTDINNTTSMESFKANGGTFDGNTALNPDGTGFTGRINNGAGYETVYRDGNIVDVGPSAQTSGTSTGANTGTNANTSTGTSTGTNANTSTGTSTNAGANASTEASAPQVKGKPNHSNTNGSQAGRPSRIDRFNKRYGNQGAGTPNSQAGAAQTPVSSATKLSGNFSERLQGIKGKIGQESFARSGLSQRISAFKGLKQETISAMPDEFIIDSLNNPVNSSKFVESLGTLEQEFTSTELSNLFGKYYGREYAHMYCRGQYNSPAEQQQILQAMRSLAGKKAA